MPTQLTTHPIIGWAAQFSADPNSPSAPVTGWSGLSERVEGSTAEYGVQYELNQPEAGTAELRVLNKDEYLNPRNTSSPFNSAGNLLVPYRKILGTATWPNGLGGSATGNLLNASNITLWGGSTDSSTFEGATVGAWTATGTTPAAVTTTTSAAQQGTRSMQVTWPTATNGGLPAVTAVTLTNQGPFKIGQQYTLSLYARGNAGTPKVRVAVAGQVTVGPTNNATFQRVAVTFTATDVWHTVQVYPDTNTTSGQVALIDAVQVDLGGAASTFATTGPVTYPIFAGFIERYPFAWTAKGYLGRSTLTCVDPLALLARVTLRPVHEAEIAQDAPVFTHSWADPNTSPQQYPAQADWSTAPAGSWTFVTVGGTGVAPAWQAASKPQVEDGQSILFQPTSGAGQWVAYGYLPPSAASLGLTSLTGITYETWWRHPSAMGSSDEVMFAQASQATLAVQYVAIEFGLTASGQPFVRRNSGGSGTSYSYNLTDTSRTTYVDNDWHHTVFTGATSGGSTTWTLYVDGVQRAQVTGSANPSTFPSYMLFGATQPANPGDPWRGGLAWTSVYPSTMSAQRVADHYRAFRVAHDRDTTGQRLRRALAWAGWNGVQNVPDGQSVLGPATGYDGKTVLDVAKDAGTAEMGYALAAPDGDLTFVTRDQFYVQTTSTVTFGEDTTLGEVPYQDGIAYDFDPQYLANIVEVTGVNGVTAGAASDATSKVRYFPSSLQLSTALALLREVTAYRDHLLNRYEAPRLRVKQITVNPAANPSLWPTALGLSFGARVTVKRRTSAFTMSDDFYVLSRQHETGPGTWLTTFSLVPVEPTQAWILGDATYGLLGTTTTPLY